MDSLQLLKELFPGQVQLPLLAVGKVCGMAMQTTKNRVWDGSFPIPVGREGKRRFCHILDVAAYLDAQRAGGAHKKKRGRPSKAEQIERQAAAAGGEK